MKVINLLESTSKVTQQLSFIVSAEDGYIDKFSNLAFEWLLSCQLSHMIPDKRRVVFHIDVNSAFVSWSAVKIISEGGQDIRLVPSVVSGDPNDRRSIVAAKSIPCRKYGINTAEPVSMAIRKCPGLVIVQGDWEWYRKCSMNFIAICRTYSPILQQFSVDECFIEMTGRMEGRDPVHVADTLREEIRSRLGFTVNVGIGSNKLLAKMASDFEKPDKTHTLWSEEVEYKMWPLPVGDLLWVGRKTRERLTAYGIRTIGDLAVLPVTALERVVGQRYAQMMHDNANGLDDSPVSTEEAEAKSYSAERTFREDISDPKALDRELFNAACEVAHRIRRDAFHASGVTVFVKTKDFEVRSKQCSMAQPTNVTAILLNEARKLIPFIWDGVTSLRQVGFGVFRLTHETGLQLSLFEDENIGYYRQWDKDYDAKMELRESDSRHRKRGGEKALLFSYHTGEEALSAAKKVVRSRKGLFLARTVLDDGQECFAVIDNEGNVLEKHSVLSILR